MADDLLMTQEELDALLNTRGFESGFVTTPLRDFWGVLDSITGVMRQGQRGAYAVILFNFSQVEVIRATESYDSPIAQIEIPSSNRDKSKMGYWGESVDAIINAGIDKTIPHNDARVKNQKHLVGQKIHVAMTPGHLIPEKDEATGQFVDKPKDCWTLIEVAGMGAPAAAPPPPPVAATPGVVAGAPVAAPVAQAPTGAPIETPEQRAVTLLNGRTEVNWHQACFADPLIKDQPTLVGQIINGTFIGALRQVPGKIVDNPDGTITVAN